MNDWLTRAMVVVPFPLWMAAAAVLYWLVVRWRRRRASAPPDFRTPLGKTILGMLTYPGDWLYSPGHGYVPKPGICHQSLCVQVQVEGLGRPVVWWRAKSTDDFIDITAEIPEWLLQRILRRADVLFAARREEHLQAQAKIHVDALVGKQDRLHQCLVCRTLVPTEVCPVNQYHQVAVLPPQIVLRRA